MPAAAALAAATGRVTRFFAQWRRPARRQAGRPARGPESDAVTVAVTRPGGLRLGLAESDSDGAAGRGPGHCSDSEPRSASPSGLPPRPRGLSAAAAASLSATVPRPAGESAESESSRNTVIR